MDNSLGEHTVFEIWVESTSYASVATPLRAVLESCSASLKTLFQQCDEGLSEGLVGSMVQYITAPNAELRAAQYERIVARYDEVRQAAVQILKWDYQKGPFLELSHPTRYHLSGSRGVIASRCQTVTAFFEMVNCKYPAVPGEGNVPKLRILVALNPHDERNSTDFAKGIRAKLHDAYSALAGITLI